MVFCSQTRLPQIGPATTTESRHTDATQLFDLTNTVVIPPSIDPFFFKITWHEEEEGEGGDFGFKRLEIEGLHYERLSIKRKKTMTKEKARNTVRSRGFLGRILGDIDNEEEDE